MVAELNQGYTQFEISCSLAKISMVAELPQRNHELSFCCSLAKISMVAEPQNI